MNLRFSSSNILKLEGLKTLDEEAIIFFGKRSIKEDKEEKGEDDFSAEGSRLRLEFVESEEVEDMMNKTAVLKQNNKVL